MKMLSVRDVLVLACVGAATGCSSASDLGTNDGGVVPDGAVVNGGAGGGGPENPLPDGGDGGSTGPGGALRVFVTATTYASTSLGGGASGFAGADRFCANAAEAASLGGSWVAWLSTTSTNAIDRITAKGPWYLVDGKTLVFPNSAALATRPLVGIGMDERGSDGSGLGGELGPSRDVWTGTANGGVASETCLDWGTSVGNQYGTRGVAGLPPSWTSAGTSRCNDSNSLYCFEVKK